MSAEIHDSARRAPGHARQKYWLGLALVAVSAISLSLITTFSKLAYQAGSTPVTLVWARFATFVALVGLYLLLSGKSFRLPRRNMRGTAVLALGMFMMSFGYLSSVAYIDVGLAVILLYSFPLMVGVLSAAAGRERVSPVKALCLIVAFAGLVCAIGPALENMDWRGVAFALAAALGVAITVTWGGTYLEDVEPLVVNTWANVWMLIAMTLYLAALGGVALPGTGAGWIGLAGATGCYIFGFVALFVAMKWVTPAQTAVTLNIEPIFSIAAAVLVLHESIAWSQAFGIAIILIAIVFSALWGAMSKP